jgi:predicted RNA-binding protein YlqC (UPF0109 family)
MSKMFPECPPFKVIGKQGRTVNAIRIVLNAASGKTRKRYVLDLVE